MNRRNREHVAIDPDSSYYWIFVVPETATTTTEHVQDIRSLATGVLEAGSEMVRPTTVVYYERRYPEDADPASTEPLETIERSVESDDGFTAESLAEEIDVDYSGPVRIPEVRFDRCKVRIRLEDGDSWIDRGDRCVPYNAGEPVDWEGVRDPLTVRIEYATNIEHPGLDAEYVYYVRIKPQSDIWFEDTEIGSINRAYLSSYLEDVYEQVSPDLVLREPDRVGQVALDEIF